MTKIPVGTTQDSTDLFWLMVSEDSFHAAWTEYHGGGRVWQWRSVILWRKEAEHEAGIGTLHDLHQYRAPESDAPYLGPTF